MFKYIVFLVTNLLFLLAGYRWVQSNVSYPILLDNFQHININAAIMSSIPYWLLLILYAVRTKFLLKRSFPHSFVVSIMGHGFNNLCPFRLGEFVRIMLARRFYSISAYDLGLSIILEKSFDLICVCLLGTMVLYGLSDFGSTWLLVIALCVATTIVMLIFGRFDVFKIFPENFFLKNHLKRLNQAIIKCELNKNFFSVSICSLLIWVLAVLQFYLYFSLSIPDVHVSIFDSVTLVVITAVAFVMPITIGSIGVFEGVVIFFFQRNFNLTAEHALVLASMLHLLIAIPQIMGTVLCVFYKEASNALGFGYSGKEEASFN